MYRYFIKKNKCTAALMLCFFQASSQKIQDGDELGRLWNVDLKVRNTIN